MILYCKAPPWLNSTESPVRVKYLQHEGDELLKLRVHFILLLKQRVHLILLLLHVLEVLLKLVKRGRSCALQLGGVVDFVPDLELLVSLQQQLNWSQLMRLPIDNNRRLGANEYLQITSCARAH